MHLIKKITVALVLTSLCAASNAASLDIWYDMPQWALDIVSVWYDVPQ